jgi:Ser/Thr protein kinase RdoA (MazF antagonist)
MIPRLMASQTSDMVLQECARIALRDFKVTPSRLTHLASRHNDVFRIDAPSGERFVLRIQNDLMTDAQARSQVEWLEILSKQSDVIVPAPLRTQARRAFTYVETDTGKRRAVLLQWLPGRPATTRNDAVYRSAARMIARLHLQLAIWHAVLCPRRQSHAASQHVEAQSRRDHRKVCSRDAMDNLGHCKRRFGVIHSDLNLDNIVFNRARPSPIDFDEFGRCWYVFDLAELIRTSINPDNWLQRKQLAIGAYIKVRVLDDAEMEAFDAFAVATFVQYLNWAFIHARNKDDLRWVGFCIDVIRHIACR